MLLIVDKDFTIVRPHQGKHPQSPHDQIALPGAFKALKKAKVFGFDLVIASNQGGIAAGHKTWDNAMAEMNECQKLFDRIFDWIIFCPDDGHSAHVVGKGGSFNIFDVNSKYAQTLDFPGLDVTPDFFCKPRPGMLTLAMALTENSDISQVAFVGDMDTDRQAANAIYVQFMEAHHWRMVGSEARL